MLEYQDRTVREVAACTCDRCQRRMTAEDPFEWHEKLSIAYRGGYGSIFGDGWDISIDLCQQCVKETLGTWLRITPSDDWAVSDPVSLADALAQHGDDADFEFDAPRVPPATNIVTLGIDSERAVTARFAAAMKGEAQGSFITFASPELLFQTFTQPRWHIVKAMTGVGPLSLPELARRVGCDVEAVHDDVRALLETGVVESTAEGAIVFPYDAVHVDFMLPAG